MGSMAGGHGSWCNLFDVTEGGPPGACVSRGARAYVCTYVPRDRSTMIFIKRTLVLKDQRLRLAQIFTSSARGPAWTQAFRQGLADSTLLRPRLQTD